MDKNSIIGIILIFGILIVFSIMNQPSEEDIEAAKRRRDSIAQVEAEKKALEQQQAEQQSEETLSETVLPDTINADAEYTPCRYYIRRRE